MYKKNVLALVIILFCAMFFSTQVEASKYNDALKAYKKYFSKNLDNYDHPYAEYKLCDIDKNGVPEMIVSYMSGVRAGFKIYTYKQSNVKHVKSFEGGCRVCYNKSKKQIAVLTSGGAADNKMQVFKLSGTKLKKVCIYESKGLYQSYSLVGVKYYKNGLKISKSKYNKYCDDILNHWKMVY